MTKKDLQRQIQEMEKRIVALEEKSKSGVTKVISSTVIPSCPCRDCKQSASHSGAAGVSWNTVPSTR